MLRSESRRHIIAGPIGTASRLRAGARPFSSQCPERLWGPPSRLSSFPVVKATEAWISPSPFKCRGLECVELYHHSPIRLHGEVLNQVQLQSQIHSAVFSKETSCARKWHKNFTILNVRNKIVIFSVLVVFVEYVFWHWFLRGLPNRINLWSSCVSAVKDKCALCSEEQEEEWAVDEC
jgi:hypothetical protein